MESAPQVMRVPLAVTRQRLPGWVIALIAALTVAVAALAAVSWRQILAPALEARSDAASAPASLIERRGAPAPELDRPAALEAILAPERATAAAEDPAPPAASTAASKPEDAPPSETADIAPASAARSEPTAATNSRGAAAVVDAAPAAPPEPRAASLPSLAALRAEGVAVPVLDMQLHVFSASRASRFVLVNGARYGEGQEIAPGAVLVGIAREGAIVRFNGREFLLPAN